VKKILVTGSEGFIGSHLVELLVSRGYSVRALVQYNSFNNKGWLEELDSKTLSSVETVLGDIRDPNLVRRVVRGCDSVIHLAALIAIPYSYSSPHSYVETNINGTLNVLEAVKELEVGKLIQASTSEVYGTAEFVPITENHPLKGQSPYAASKIGADQLARAYFASYGTPVQIVRPFNTYGPRQSTRAVIPTIIMQLVNGQHEIEIGNLDATRDFSYVVDTALGFIAALEYQGGFGEVFNLGSNFEVSIRDTVDKIAKLMDREVSIRQSTRRLRPAKSEVERLWSDNSKALSTFNWKPLYTDLSGFERGLSESIDWFSEPLNVQKYRNDDFSL
jgi:NAD dependent epimerase/dehydratase